MQSCTCYKRVHLKCSLLFFSRFKTLGSSHSWSCPPFCVPASSGDSTLTSTVTSSSDCSSLYASTAQFGPSAPPLLMQHSRSTLPSNLLSFFRSLHIFSLCKLITASCFWLFLFAYCFLFSSLTPSGFFNGMLADSEPGALNFYSSFCLISLTLFVFRNLTLTYLPLSESLDSLLCDLIAFTPGLVFFLLMSQTLATASSFLSSRAFPSLNFLLPLFLRLTPTLIM